MDQSTKLFSLNQLVDLSLNPPDGGTVNFKVLRIALKIIITELKLEDIYARIFVKDLQVPAALVDERTLESHFKKHGLTISSHELGSDIDLRKKIVKRAELNTSEGKEVPIERIATENVVVFDYEYDQDLRSIPSRTQVIRPYSIDIEHPSSPEKLPSPPLPPISPPSRPPISPSSQEESEIGAPLPEMETRSLLSLAMGRPSITDMLFESGNILGKMDDEVKGSFEQEDEKAKESEQDNDYYIEKHGTGSYVELYGSDGKYFKRTGKLQDDMERAFRLVAEELDNFCMEFELHKRECEMRNQENAKNAEEVKRQIEEITESVNGLGGKLKEVVQRSEYVLNNETVDGRLDELCSKIVNLANDLTEENAKVTDFVKETTEFKDRMAREMANKIAGLNSEFAKMLNEEATRREQISGRTEVFAENATVLETKLNEALHNIEKLSNLDDAECPLVRQMQEFSKHEEEVQVLLDRIQGKVAELKSGENEQKRKLYEQNEEFLKNRNIMRQLLEEVKLKLAVLNKKQDKRKEEICVKRLKEVIQSLLERIEILEKTPLLETQDQPEEGRILVPHECPQEINDVQKVTAGSTTDLETNTISSTTSSYP